jgi:hypothetical protein
MYTDSMDSKYAAQASNAESDNRHVQSHKTRRKVKTLQVIALTCSTNTDSVRNMLIFEFPNHKIK